MNSNISYSADKNVFTLDEARLLLHISKLESSDIIGAAPS